MLWYKSWLETRWRFVIGLVILVCSAAAIVFAHPEVMKLMPLARETNVPGEIGRRIREAAELLRDYRGYVWSEWMRDQLVRLGTLFAVLLGAGGLLSQRSGTLFTLSMPVSRNRLLAVRSATGLAQWLVLAFVPSLVIPLLSPSVGQTYRVADVLAHGACAFVVGSVFFSLSLLLSTVFDDVWRPLLIALAVAIGLGIAEQAFRGVADYGLFRAMGGESWFRSGELPWGGLLAAAALSIAMQFGTAMNIARRDF
jgi:hypothetical protein